MKEIILKIKARRWLQVALAVVLVSALSLGIWQGTQAVAANKDRKKVVEIKYGNDYDVSIGNAGVFIPNAVIEGSMVLIHQEHPENHAGSCDLSTFTEWAPDSSCPGGGSIIWVQNMLDVRIYEDEEGGRQYGQMRGLGYVYFDLDILDRRSWDEHGGDRMSIWYFHDFLNKWVECPTTLRRETGAPRGRLTCYMEEFGVYGLGIREIPFINKLIKFGIPTTTPTVTLTPTNTSTPTKTPTLTPTP